MNERVPEIREGYTPPVIEGRGSAALLLLQQSACLDRIVNSPDRENQSVNIIPVIGNLLCCPVAGLELICEDNRSGW